MSYKRNVKVSKGGKAGVGYILFKLYVKFMFYCCYNRKMYVVGRENIPQNCPLLIVSDHQNSMNDALALLYAIKNRRGKRKIRAITRADAFDIPYLGTVMHWLGLLPAFRISYGVENLSGNMHAFSEASDELLKNGTVFIYPESGHQDKHWLGNFTYGYLRLAFEAAEKCNFEKEIYILPSCNHYTGYFAEKEDVLIKFGKPVPISQYYERYKIKPRTVQKELNADIHQKVSELMLDVRDLDNYRAIDFIRNTYGIKYAEYNGFDPENLAEKLISDKQLCSRLETLKTANEAEIQSVYDSFSALSTKIDELGIEDRFFDKKISGVAVFAKMLLHAVALPLYLIACIANFTVIYPPKLINRKVHDYMLHASVKVAVACLAGIPLANIIVFLSVGLTTGSVFAAITGVAVLPFLYIFAVCFDKAHSNCRKELRFCKLLKQGKLNDLMRLRTETRNTLEKLLK
ncbi:MAG: 1-acyl-sn-glycerol-3-phosphate acyltransferase [Prevotellaceae bacterium]|jgi:1-acyl-sn-glycerol-3-phosphate acyltransferase|nr:1-acyl-sn-glycerol-3-phosphate acyltransferase [Prevotellaceae bacterium]